MFSTLTRAYRAIAVTVAANLTISKLSQCVGNLLPLVSNSRAIPVLESLEGRALMSATYYVSASGNDSNTGTSTGNAWKSISKVNSVDLNAGDSVLFQGGQTFYGSLSIGSKDSGSSSSAVTFGSYNGQATINSGKSSGAIVNDASGIWFENLKFVGTPSSAQQAGITFQGYGKGTYYTNDRVDSCDISGYWTAGILLEAAYSNAGLSGLRITNNSIYNNVEAGVDAYAADDNSITGLYVGSNQVYNNYGDGSTAATGNGIELGGVSNTTVEYNVAYLNGSKGGIGGVGIWAYNATNVVFQYNESYDNKTTRGNDGDGFDFDADVSNSVMQYNYAFGNDGTGAQLDQWKNDSLFTNDIIRYNVFQDNGRKNSYGNLEVWGKVLNSYLYNNVIYTTPGNSGSNSGIRVHNSTIPGLYVNGVHFVNNIIDTTGGATLINVTAGEAQGAKNLTFTGNVYWTNGSSFNIIDGTSTLHSLSSWQSAGQETWDGKKYGINANPDFVSANSAVATALASLNTLSSAASGYKLAANSPALDETLSVTSMYGVATGGKDYYGDTISSSAATVAGADQSKVGTPAAVIATGTGSSTSSGSSSSGSTSTTNSSSGSLSLTGLDIGSVSTAGSNSVSNGSYTVTAAGSDIWGAADSFRYDYTKMTGNGTIIAKVASLSTAADFAKAGVMVRNTLSSNSADVSMLISPDHDINYESRSTAGGSTSDKNENVTSAAWVKLVRSGNTFTGYISSNGTTWTQVSTSSVSMNSTVYVGLAVTAHESKGTETAVFSDVTIS